MSRESINIPSALETHENVFSTRLIVPKALKDGNFLTPVQFNLVWEVLFCLGRYNAGDDTIEFVLCGRRGIEFNISISNIDSQGMGWTVKRHGTTMTNQDDLYVMDGVFTTAHDVSRQFDQTNEMNFQVERIQAEAFAREDILRVPYAQIRDGSSSRSLLDAREKNIVGPWAFHGGSFPEQYYRLELKITLSKEDTNDILDHDFRRDEVLYCSSPTKAIKN